MRIGRLFISVRWRERLDEEQRIRESITSNVRAMLRDRDTDLYQAVVKVSRGVIKDVIEEQWEAAAEASKIPCESAELGTWDEHAFSPSGTCARCGVPELATHPAAALLRAVRHDHRQWKDTRADRIPWKSRSSYEGRVAE